MTQRTRAIQLLYDYFEEQGEFLTPAEYKKRTDTPIRFMRIRQIFGSWNRMENIVRKINARNEKPEGWVAPTDVDKVLEERRLKEVEEFETVKSTEEELKKKAAAEAAANKEASEKALAAAIVSSDRGEAAVKKVESREPAAKPADAKTGAATSANAKVEPKVDAKSN